MEFQIFQCIQIVSSKNNSYYTHMHANTFQFEFKTNSTLGCGNKKQQVEFAGTLNVKLDPNAMALYGAIQKWKNQRCSTDKEGGGGGNVLKGALWI